MKSKDQFIPESQSTHLPTDLTASENLKKPHPLEAAREGAETVSAKQTSNLTETCALIKISKSPPMFSPLK